MEQPPNLKQHDKPLLLVVDDHPSNVQTLYELFKDECEVCMATDGHDALEFCQNKQPDLILLDVIMPEVGGYDVCKKLKSDPLTKNIPVIFVTAQTDPLEEAQGFDAGGVDFISKPFHANVVIARVRTHLTLKRQSDLLRKLSLTDGLTGVANRRHFDETLEVEWRRCARAGHSLALIMIDIDFFKRYNDHYGHQAGDACLKSVALILKENLSRSHDLIARYGGEEFVCILPNTNLEGARLKALQLEAAVRELHVKHEKSDVADVVTISLGVAVVSPDHNKSPSELVACADSQLYLAKRNGRGQMHSTQIYEA